MLGSACVAATQAPECHACHVCQGYGITQYACSVHVSHTMHVRLYILNPNHTCSKFAWPWSHLACAGQLRLQRWSMLCTWSSQANRSCTPEPKPQSLNL